MVLSSGCSKNPPQKITFEIPKSNVSTKTIWLAQKVLTLLSAGLVTTSLQNLETTVRILTQT